jgi:hypothetical protein
MAAPTSRHGGAAPPRVVRVGSGRAPAWGGRGKPLTALERCQGIYSYICVAQLPNWRAPARHDRRNSEIEIASEMVDAGIRVPVESGILKDGDVWVEEPLSSLIYDDLFQCLFRAKKF